MSKTKKQNEWTDSDAIPSPDDLEVARDLVEAQTRDGATSGAEALAQRLDETLNQQQQQMMAGDRDLLPEDPSSVGEQAPGGPMSSPDQGDVDEIGRAAGVEYDDTEPVTIDRKIEERDDRRWELDPASSEDYRERLERRKE